VVARRAGRAGLDRRPGRHALRGVPGSTALVVQAGGRTTVYDTGDHRIGGFSQQQGGTSSATFTSQHGTVRLADLRVAGEG
jgi:hypothetical protein